MSRLIPAGLGAGPLRYADLEARWTPGMLRDIVMQEQRDACACTRELAANGLSHVQQRFENSTVLGKGAFGIVHQGLCKRTRKEYAVKTAKIVRRTTGRRLL